MIPAILARRPAWTPAKNALLSWFEPSPATAFSDAGGTVPSTVGGVVQTLKVKSGPTFTFSQATGVAQPILQQAANGKYYLSCSTTSWMETVGNIAYVANSPFSMASAYRLNAALASAQCIMSMHGANATWANNVAISGVSYGAGNLRYGAVALNGVKNKWILTSSGVSNADPVFYRDQVADAVTSNPNLQTYPAYTGKVALNVRTGVGTFIGPVDYFGFGWINGTQLTASEITKMNAYMTKLMQGA